MIFVLIRAFIIILSSKIYFWFSILMFFKLIYLNVRILPFSLRFLRFLIRIQRLSLTIKCVLFLFLHLLIFEPYPFKNLIIFHKILFLKHFHNFTFFFLLPFLLNLLNTFLLTITLSSHFYFLSALLLSFILSTLSFFGLIRVDSNRIPSISTHQLQDILFSLWIFVISCFKPCVFLSFSIF